MMLARGDQRWAALVISALLLAVAVRPAAPAAAPRRSLAGDLLVASDEMRDPRFAQTVIYVIRHDATGAQGIIVNRPVGEVPMAVLLEQMGMSPRGASGAVRLHRGGPVDPLRILVLHTADYRGEGTMTVKDGIAVTSEPDILRAIADGKGPSRMLFALGYAGWAPGQLEAEIDAGAWTQAVADRGILFDSDYDSKWQRAIARRKIDL
jgi:putative transcriptional regulator